MFSTKHRLRWSAVALAGAIGIGSAAMADTIVISSTGPSARSYPSGKSLAAGSRIVLAAGDMLTLIDSRGTRTLRGPITTSAEAVATRANTSFANLVATQNRRRPRTGAMRGAEGEDAKKPSNLWDVNATVEGTFCIASPTGIQIWRPDMKRAATITITPEGGAGASASFLEGSNVAAWPARLPIAEGRSYVLSGGGLPRAVRVRFTLLSAAPTDPASTYAALHAKGCAAQEALLLGSTAPK